MRDWGIEQKWMSILLPLLLLYNGELQCYLSSSQVFSLIRYNPASPLCHLVTITAAPFYIHSKRTVVSCVNCGCYACPVLFAVTYCVLLRLLFRSVFPAVVPGEQLVSGDVGRFLSGSVPVRPAALLALRLPWHQGSGGSSYYTHTFNGSVSFFSAHYESHFMCLMLFPQGERKCLTFYLPKLIIVGLLWLSAFTLGIWQT